LDGAAIDPPHRAGAVGTASTPAPTLLASVHVRLRALAYGLGTTALAVTIWDYPPRNGCEAWTRRYQWRATVFSPGVHSEVLTQVESDDPDAMLAGITNAIHPLCATVAPDVLSLGELPPDTSGPAYEVAVRDRGDWHCTDLDGVERWTSLDDALESIRQAEPGWKYRVIMHGDPAGVWEGDVVDAANDLSPAVPT
jgi:hypothetical protein